MILNTQMDEFNGHETDFNVSKYSLSGLVITKN